MRKEEGREPFIVPNAWEQVVRCMSVVDVVMTTVLGYTDKLLVVAGSFKLPSNVYFIRQAP